MLAKCKVVLVGEEGVGKSSLIRRFVHDEFDEAYRSTLGVKVSKKEMVADVPGLGNLPVSMVVWDIMGTRGFRDLLKESYFHGANGVLAVCDLTNPETLPQLDVWIELVRSVEAGIPAVILGNKADLQEMPQIPDGSLVALATRHRCSFLKTSAKTGEHVEAAFARVVEAMVSRFESPASEARTDSTGS